MILSNQLEQKNLEIETNEINEKLKMKKLMLLYLLDLIDKEKFIQFHK